MNKRIVGSLLLILVIGGAFYMVPRIKRLIPFFRIKGDAIKVGEPVAYLALVNGPGEMLRLSDYRGKVLLLNFYGSW